MIKDLIKFFLGFVPDTIKPRGYDLEANIRRFLPRWKAELIFDVGANVGQTAIRFTKEFPGAKILSFEPFKETFLKLQTNTAGCLSVTAYCLAFSSQSRILNMQTGDCSVQNKILTENQDPLDPRSVLKVEAVSLDDFCSKEIINHISLLKIDAEGHDLEILRGSERFLERQAIDMILVEAGMNFYNKDHIHILEFIKFLASKNYLLFGIYEQTGEFIQGFPCMRRCNALFISEELNRGHKAFQ